MCSLRVSSRALKFNHNIRYEENYYKIENDFIIMIDVTEDRFKIYQINKNVAGKVFKNYELENYINQPKSETFCK